MTERFSYIINFFNSNSFIKKCQVFFMDYKIIGCILRKAANIKFVI